MQADTFPNNLNNSPKKFIKLLLSVDSNNFIGRFRFRAPLILFIIESKHMTTQSHTVEFVSKRPVLSDYPNNDFVGQKRQLCSDGGQQ